MSLKQSIRRTLASPLSKLLVIPVLTALAATSLMAQSGDQLIVSEIHVRGPAFFSQEVQAFNRELGLGYEYTIRRVDANQWEITNKGSSSRLVNCQSHGEALPGQQFTVTCGRPFIISLSSGGSVMAWMQGSQNYGVVGQVAELTTEILPEDTSLLAKGVVTQAGSDKVIAGATVQVKGAGRQVRTNGAGEYEIEIDGGDAVLQFAYEGTVTQEIAVSSGARDRHHYTVNAAMACGPGTAWFTGRGQECLSPGTQLRAKGTVFKHPLGTGLPGATVTEAGTGRTATTDAQGQYTLDVDGVDSVLVYSYPGTKTREIAAATHNFAGGEFLVQAHLQCEAGVWKGGTCTPCGEGATPGTTGACIAGVEFLEWYREGGLTLEAAKRHSAENGWVLATAEEVEAVWRYQAYDRNVYGMLADGRLAVPIQNNQSNAPRGVNAGAEGEPQGYFYVRATAVDRGAATLEANLPKKPKTAGRLEIAQYSAEQQAQLQAFLGQQSQLDPDLQKTVRAWSISSACAFNKINQEFDPPEQNWMMDMWPDGEVPRAGSELLVEAAKEYLSAKGYAADDATVQQLAAEVKTDPVRRYEYAPFMLKAFWNALQSGAHGYRAKFEVWKSCADYWRATHHLQEWDRYQNESTGKYQPTTFSALNFEHSPSLEGFAYSDPMDYGPAGGGTIALLFLPLVVHSDLPDNPYSEFRDLVSDDMVGVTVGAGLGSSTATTAALVGSTAAWQAAAAAHINSVIVPAAQQAVTHALDAVATAQAALSKAPLNTAQYMTAAGRLLEAEQGLLAAKTNLGKASGAAAKVGGKVISKLLGPAVVAIVAAAILATTVAEIVKKDEFRRKLEDAVEDSYKFTVADFLDVQPSETETRRRALFLLMVENLIGEPAERGKLTLELPVSEAISGPRPRRIYNEWYPHNHIHTENGALGIGPIEKGWTSAQWVLVPLPGSEDLVRIRNVYRTGEYLHFEGHKLQVGPIQPNWASAVWRLEELPGGWVRIQNQWYPDRHLNYNRYDETVELVPVENNWASARWRVE